MSFDLFFSLKHTSICTGEQFCLCSSDTCPTDMFLEVPLLCLSSCLVFCIELFLIRGRSQLGSQTEDSTHKPEVKVNKKNKLRSPKYPSGFISKNKFEQTQHEKLEIPSSFVLNPIPLNFSPTRPSVSSTRGNSRRRTSRSHHLEQKTLRAELVK